MKILIWSGCFSAVVLAASIAVAGQQGSHASAAAVASSHHSSAAVNPSYNRFQPGMARSFNRPVLGGQRITSGTRFNQQRFAANRGQFSSRARTLATSHSHSWWRNHRHERFLFIDDFGFDPLFFDPYFYDYGYYPYGYPYGYYPPDFYPYGGGGGYYGGGYPSGPNYDSPQDEDSKDNVAPAPDNYSNGRYGGGGRGGGGVVMEVQRRLARDGYYRGSADGLMGSRTHYAIRAYQRDHGLQVDGEISEDVLRTLGVR